MVASGRGQFLSKVKQNTQLCLEHYLLVLEVCEFPPTEPGEFVQISCRSGDEASGEGASVAWDAAGIPEAHGAELRHPQAFLRRPFSLAGREDSGAEAQLHIIHRVVGVGTEWLSRLKPGDPVDVLGPLGNRFALPPQGHPAILVGGGVGIPPMLYLAARLEGCAAVAFCGAVSRDLLPLTISTDSLRPGADEVTPRLSVREFARHGIPSVISTDDGSFGFRGYVTQALQRYLDSTPGPKELAGAAPILYTCGPEPMMKRVAQIAAERGLECQVAVERAMACGMGTCQSCCIRVRKPDCSRPPLAGCDWCWRLACTDGPIFRGADLLW